MDHESYLTSKIKKKIVLSFTLLITKSFLYREKSQMLIYSIFRMMLKGVTRYFSIYN